MHLHDTQFPSQLSTLFLTCYCWTKVNIEILQFCSFANQATCSCGFLFPKGAVLVFWIPSTLKAGSKALFLCLVWGDGSWGGGSDCLDMFWNISGTTVLNPEIVMTVQQLWRIWGSEGSDIQPMNTITCPAAYGGKCLEGGATNLHK